MKFQKGDLIEYKTDFFVVMEVGGPKGEDWYKLHNLTKLHPPFNAKTLTYFSISYMDRHATKIG